MIIISSSQDLEDNPNLVIIDCIKSFGHFFFCQPTGKVPAPAKASHHLCKKAFQHVQLLHLWKKIPWLWGVWKHNACMFEGGNLLSLNLTPVTNTPWKHCNLTSCVTQLQSHLCQRQSDLFIILFLRKLCAICICLLQFAFCVCTRKSRLGRSCLKFVTQLFLHGPGIIITCITWVMQFIIFKRVV